MHQKIEGENCPSVSSERLQNHRLILVCLYSVLSELRFCCFLLPFFFYFVFFWFCFLLVLFCFVLFCVCVCVCVCVFLWWLVDYNMRKGKPLESINVQIPLPKTVAGATVSSTWGQATYDEISRVCLRDTVFCNLA